MWRRQAVPCGAVVVTNRSLLSQQWTCLGCRDNQAFSHGVEQRDACGAQQIVASMAALGPIIGRRPA
jgi:hypothetical protein